MGTLFLGALKQAWHRRWCSTLNNSIDNRAVGTFLCTPACCSYVRPFFFLFFPRSPPCFVYKARRRSSCCVSGHFRRRRRGRDKHLMGLETRRLCENCFAASRCNMRSRVEIDVTAALTKRIFSFSLHYFSVFTQGVSISPLRRRACVVLWRV